MRFHIYYYCIYGVFYTDSLRFGKIFFHFLSPMSRLAEYHYLAGDTVCGFSFRSYEIENFDVRYGSGATSTILAIGEVLSYSNICILR